MIPEEDIEIFQTAIDELRAQGLDEDMVTEQIVIALAVKYDESEGQLDLDPKFIDDALAQLGLGLGGSSEDDEADPDEEFKSYPVGSILHIDGSQVLDQLEGNEMDRLLEEGTFPAGQQQFVEIIGQNPLELKVLAQGPDYDDDDDDEIDYDEEFRQYPVGSILHIDGSQVLEELDDDTVKKAIAEGAKGFEHFTSGLRQVIRITSQDPLEYQVVAEGPDYDDEPAPEQPPMMTQEVIDDETILSILGSAELLKLIRSKDSPFDIEIADRLDAKGVTLLYDNQRASRIIRTIEGVDNGNPIYGMPLSEEANVIFRCLGPTPRSPASSSARSNPTCATTDARPRSRTVSTN